MDRTRKDILARSVCEAPQKAGVEQLGLKNFLIEGVSCTGKTTVCDELVRRGHRAIHGDRELAYQGDPETGAPVDGSSHTHHVWDIDRVRALATDPSHPMTFFCGGSRNFHQFIDLFDGIFVLAIDRETLERRLDLRASDEWGGQPNEREIVLRLHATQEDVPHEGLAIDATRPLSQVVDTILAHANPSVRRPSK